MASNTSRLGLLKKDPVADGNDTFNIKTMLNDNWDKIDQKVALLGSDGKLDPSQIDTSGLATKQELAAHQADETTHGIGDKKTLLTTNKTTIVASLNELFQFANDGKTNIASVIGSPATNGDTFAQLKTHIQNAKSKGAANLTAKGTIASDTESLDSLMSKIANVNTGKKWASGTITLTSNNYNSISGLTFKPSIIVLYHLTTGYYYTFIGTPDRGFNTMTMWMGGFDNYNSNITGISDKSVTVNNDGITFYSRSNATFNWVAFE